MKEVLIEKSRIDLGDYFEFLVSGPKMDLDGAPYGGVRFQVEALIDGIRFTIFDLDIGIGDVWIEPHDNLRLKNYLDFAGFESPEIEVISIEQHFAEKIHAYTLPRLNQNSRVKDLVDLYLLIENELLDLKLLKESLEATFKRRETHELPKKLEAPPESWRRSYEGFNLSQGMDDSFKKVQEFFLKIH
ncbi:MAG: nucleotidyl transferase AbiEii/AbiGii toxin family protein [Bacteriovorax sp.]|nr:nucleotidyl transferase AbiEii/AbiGii toxin family protein [Bacteriovorax sp.]